MNRKIPESDLILNPDGSIYHLNVRPGELAETILLVGDPGRVKKVSQHFDKILFKKEKREFITHTGVIGSLPISVVSTGIGIDNIDITINELDAIFNIDLKTRRHKKKLTCLRLVRLGTCGIIPPEIPVDSFIVSRAAFSFDGFGHYYDLIFNEYEKSLLKALKKHFAQFPLAAEGTYASQASSHLLDFFPNNYNFYQGITLTSSSFYGAQYRKVRAPLKRLDLLDLAKTFIFKKSEKITNFEMETAAIFALGKLLGHECASVSVGVANRSLGSFSKNPGKAVDRMIERILEILIATS